MDHGWDHTENEDKLLLGHVSRMGQDTHRDMYGSEVMSVSTSGCSNDKVSGSGDGSISLIADYKNHTLTVGINNVNLLFGLSPSPFEFPVLIYYYYQLCYLYSCISEICKICDSTCTCKCNCSCKPQCKSNTICLCLCDSKGEGKECCICICKKGTSKCICICICVCNKTGDTCGCNGGQHQCKKCLFKVDMSRLKDKTLGILCHLRCIRWYIQIIDKKCCFCSCCQNGRCDGSCCEPCQSITEYYKSIISRISWIESLFKEVGKKIIKLKTFKNILSLYSTIANSCKPCESCGCNDKLKELTEKIQKVVENYPSFASIVGDIRMLVDYKTFCPQANEIIEKLNKSVSPLLSKLIEINSQVLRSVDLTRISDQLLLAVYSHYCIFQCFLAMYILLQSSSKMRSILYTIRRSDICGCVKNFNPNNNGFKISYFYQYLIKSCGKNIEDPSKLFINNDGNHTCLCLVVKYVLYPSLVKSFYYMRYVYLEAIGKQTRQFITNNYILLNIIDMIKLLFLVTNVIYKITVYMKSKIYSKPAYCFCENYNHYYPYLISIILFVSSLIENIWSMDTLSIVSAIESLSSLLAEYQSIHVYTNYYSPSTYRILRRMISGLGNGNLIQKTISHCGFGMTIGQKSNGFLFNSRLSHSSTLTGKEERMTIFGTIAAQRMGLFNKTLKCGFMSFRSMFIGTEFSKDKFSLVYSKFSGISFYTQNSKVIDRGTIKTMTNLGMEISLKYLEELCKEECDQTCCKIGVCKICPIAKIKFSCLSISMKRIEMALSNVSGDMLLNYLIESVDRSRDFITNLCVGFGEVYTIMLKNLLIWSCYPMNIINIENIGITNVETRNWGYDTKYEHDVTNDRGFIRGDGYPNLTSSSYRTGIHKISSFIRLKTYFTYYKSLNKPV